MKTTNINELTDEQMDALVKLPNTNYNGCGDGSEPLYTPEMMRDYARALAIAVAPQADFEQWMRDRGYEVGSGLPYPATRERDLRAAWVAGAASVAGRFHLDIQALAANVRGAMQSTGGEAYRQALYDTILQAAEVDAKRDV